MSAAESKKRFIVTNAPTGFGKSLVGVGVAKLTDSRTVITTATKALQVQYYDDHREIGMADIRGLNSYECLEGGLNGRFGHWRREGFRADRGLPMMCDEAPCQVGAFCPRRTHGGCLYYDAYAHASNPSTDLIITNYAYWMSICEYGDGLGRVKLLILDEAHDAVDELGRFIGSELSPSEVEATVPGVVMLSVHATQKQWQEWATAVNITVTLALENIKAQIKQSEESGSKLPVNLTTLKRARDLRRLQRKLGGISMMKGDWIIEHTKDSSDRKLIKFDPVWPGDYAEHYLFRGIEKVMLISATINRDTPAKLGIKPDEVDYKEYPSTFPAARRPIVFIPTAAMNMRVAAEGMGEIITRVDQLVDRRLDRKALIQTVSYKRAKEIYYASRHRRMMMIHDPTNTRDMIRQYLMARDPVILVSPVLDTGYDFPYEAAEYQIIVKVPFPVTVDKIVQARAARDRGYRDHVTMVKLVQMVGRIMRAEDDMGETIIIDSDFDWWYRNVGRRICPMWFKEAVRFEQVLWMPPSKLVRAA